MPRTWGEFFWDITAGPFVGYSTPAPVVSLQEVNESVAIPEQKIEPAVVLEPAPTPTVEAAEIPQKKTPKPRRWEQPQDYIAPPKKKSSQQSQLWKQPPCATPENLDGHRKMPEVPPGYKWPKY